MGGPKKFKKDFGGIHNNFASRLFVIYAQLHYELSGANSFALCP